MSTEVLSAEIDEAPVAVPPKNTRGRPPLYPFDALEEGQSLFIHTPDDDEEEADQLRNRVATAANRFARVRCGGDRRFVTRVTRKDPEDEESPLGVRVWRMAPREEAEQEDEG